MSYKVIDMRVPSSKYRIKSPYKMNPTTITIHNTANRASARNEVAYMRGNNNMTSYHVAIDDKEAVQALPFSRNGWAAGDGLNGTGNRRSIHIEICYSLDNGYSGDYSKRYRQAEDNTAEYSAHVLHQYGWGTSRLRQHWNWSGKDCPHKMRAHNNWGAFKKNVQGHLNKLQGKTKAPVKKPTAVHTTPKATGNTYTVRKGDSLWSIAKANGLTVAKLKSYNNLKSDIIKTGQKLNMKAPAKKSTPKKSTSKYPKATMGKWQRNALGIQWAPATGVWINGSEPIEKRKGRPKLSATSTGLMKPGQRLDYREIARSDGHIWLLDLKSDQWVPVKEWNSRTGAVGRDWGTWM